MFYRFSILALAFSTTAAAAAELPVYEVAGFPITPHQFAVIAPMNAEQGPSPVTLTRAGMPASPHQIAVLTPRHERPAPTRTDRSPLVQAGYEPSIAGGR